MGNCFSDEEEEARKFNSRIRNGLIKLLQQVEAVFEDAELQLFFAETEIACREIFTSYAATLKSYNAAHATSASAKKKAAKRSKRERKLLQQQQQQQQGNGGQQGSAQQQSPSTQHLPPSTPNIQQQQQQLHLRAGSGSMLLGTENSAILAGAAVIPLSKAENRNFVSMVIPECDLYRLTRLFSSYVNVADRLNADRNRVSVIEAWLKFDMDASGDLDRDELEQMVTTLNFDDSLKDRLLKKVQSQVGEDGSLSFVQFDAIYSSLVNWLELEHVWRSVTEGAGVRGHSTFSIARSGRSNHTQNPMMKNNNNNSNNNNQISSLNASVASLQLGSGSNVLGNTIASAAGSIRHQNNDNNKQNNNQQHQQQLQQNQNSNNINGFSSGGGGIRLSTASLQMFLQVVQKDSNPKETANYLATALGGSVDRKSFMRYLTDRELNCVLDLKKCSSVYQDMTQPICHYFIHSSHNTYLSGDQLTSRSDPNMFRKALLEGCRCVELDCWDGIDGKTPIVYHGYTRTTKITFESCIEAISEAAFVTSDFPVILSLELHVSTASQHAMVEIMTRIFGDALFRPTYAGGSKTDFVITPAQHRRKFFLKAKRIRGSKYFQQSFQNHQEAEVNQALQQGGEQLQHREPFGGASTVDGDGNEDDNDNKDEDEDDEGEGDPDDNLRREKMLKAASGKAKSFALTKKLSDLISIESWRFKSLDLLEQREPQPHEVCSLGERMSSNFSADQESEYAEYNKYRLTRVYPSGSRMNSSNFNPQTHWNCGAQLVALNLQSEDYECRFYKGRFVDNGGCGYLLKPAYLRVPMRPLPSHMTALQQERVQQQQIMSMVHHNHNNNNNAMSSSHHHHHHTTTVQSLAITMTVSIISALCLPKPKGESQGEIVDPYVKLWLEGPDLNSPDDFNSPSNAHETVVIDNNGFHPVWRSLGNDTVTFRIPVPEMTTLCIQILDSDIDTDEELAEAFLPVHLVRCGVRCVPLWSPYNGEALTGSLLMVSIVTDRDAKLDDPIRNPHEELVGGGEESMLPGTNQNHHNHHRGGGASRDEHHMNQQQQHMKAFNKRQSEMRRMKELSKTKTVSLSAGRRH